MWAITIRDIKNSLNHVKVQKVALTLEMLLAIAENINHDDPEQCTFWAMLLTAFFLLRKSNVVPNKVSEFTLGKQFRRKDLVQKQGLILVKIKQTKTRQVGDDNLLLPLLSIPGSKLCPVKAINNMKLKIPLPQDAPAFSHKNGVVWTYRQYNACLMEKIKIIGLNPRNFSMHPVRRGGTSTQFRARVHDKMIKQIGDWKSEVYLDHLQYPMETKALAQSRVKLYLQLKAR